MPRLRVFLIEPQSYLTLHPKEKFNVEVLIDTPEDGTAELLYDNNTILTDINKKVKTIKRGKSTIRLVLRTLRISTEPTSIAVKVKTEKFLQIVQINIEIIQ